MEDRAVASKEATGKGNSAGDASSTLGGALKGAKTDASLPQKGQRNTANSTKRASRACERPLQKKKGKNQKLGRAGEDMACCYLKSNRMAILERNWACKSGEADIIAQEDDTLVFIEVKTRSEGFAGLPEYAVTKQKRTRYERIAVSYLMQKKRPSGPVRFDVIAVQMTGEQQCLLRHHRDAFAAGE